MEQKELERCVGQILWGKSVVEVLDGYCNPHIFILRSLSIKEINYLEYIYNKELHKGISAGLPTHDELITINLEFGVWGDQQEQRLKQLESLIKTSKARIKDFQFFKSKKKQEEKILQQLIKEKEKLNSIQENLFTNSAEARAEEIKRRYMVFLSTETMEEKAYWGSERYFLDETDNIIIFNLALSYLDHNLYTTLQLRKIARSPLWRFRWSMAKTGADLYGKPIAEWSEMQNMLVYWSQYYDFVFENPDRPSDNIIDDDNACDAWVEKESKKNKSSSKQDRNIFGTKKATTNKFHQEQFIMANDPESVQEIQDMNDPSTRAKLRYEHGIIQKEGSISEWKLRKGKI